MVNIAGLVVSELSTILAFAAILVFALLEIVFPRLNRRPAWRAHVPPILTLAVVGILVTIAVTYTLQDSLIRAVLPLQVASIAKLPLPAPVIFVGAFLLVDFFSFAFHWLSHVIKPLWRLHAIHHSDEDVTAVTGQLHHPGEVIASYLFLMVLFVVLGIPVVVAIFYGLIFAVHNIFVHANLALPGPVDRVLRLAIVTPDMHRTHHSIDLREGNSNFGQIFSVWDRIFGTYVDRPAVPEPELSMGLPENARPAGFTTLALLAYPFTEGRGARRR